MNDQLTFDLGMADGPRARRTVPYEAGQRFGRYTLLRRHARGEWVARCECGTEKAVRTSSLTSGHTVSCGCYAQEHRADPTKHGHGTPAKTATYQTWQHMRQRCENTGSDCYHLYGGRGILVCERWQSFETFLMDMGERPPGKTLDRFPDKDGDYEPGNCRWATNSEQAQNTARTKLTPALVAEIRALKGTASTRVLGKRYGVSSNRISAIWRGEAWK